MKNKMIGTKLFEFQMGDMFGWLRIRWYGPLMRTMPVTQLKIVTKRLGQCKPSLLHPVLDDRKTSSGLSTKSPDTKIFRFDNLQ